MQQEQDALLSRAAQRNQRPPSQLSPLGARPSVPLTSFTLTPSPLVLLITIQHKWSLLRSVPWTLAIPTSSHRLNIPAERSPLRRKRLLIIQIQIEGESVLPCRG